MKIIKHFINNEESKRTIDENGFLYVKDCPILRDGIMEYYGGEIGEKTEDGVPLDPKKIYRVNISSEELKKSLEKWKLKPIVNEHKWLGKEGEGNAKDYQEGSVGEELYIKTLDDGRNYMLANLNFTNLDTVKEIQSGEKEELSTSYTFLLKKANNDKYDLEAYDLSPNHLALVDKGRAGKMVRVANSAEDRMNTIKELYALGETSDAFIKKDAKNMADKIKLFVNNKEIDEKSFEKDDKKAEVMNEDEKTSVIEFLKNLLTKLEDGKHSADNSDSEGKKEKEKEEKKKSDNEDDKKDVEEKKEKAKEDEKSKAENYDAIYTKAYNSIKSKIEEENKEILRVYNSVKEFTGDFNFFGMSKKDILVKALNHQGIDINGKESEGEMEAMLKVCGIKSRVDNSFDYSSGNGKEETDFNF
ncbi:MAG: DUF2213 domain-containing protein [Rickettsiales bacterium]|jgi:hypothetical protein|nr:DUF2213 domain-containing protein [Rickettsiales bacterium]